MTFADDHAGAWDDPTGKVPVKLGDTETRGIFACAGAVVGNVQVLKNTLYVRAAALPDVTQEDRLQIGELEAEHVTDGDPWYTVAQRSEISGGMDLELMLEGGPS